MKNSYFLIAIAVFLQCTKAVSNQSKNQDFTEGHLRVRRAAVNEVVKLAGDASKPLSRAASSAFRRPSSRPSSASLRIGSGNVSRNLPRAAKSPLRSRSPLITRTEDGRLLSRADARYANSPAGQEEAKRTTNNIAQFTGGAIAAGLGAQYLNDKIQEKKQE